MRIRGRVLAIGLQSSNYYCALIECHIRGYLWGFAIRGTVQQRED